MPEFEAAGKGLDAFFEFECTCLDHYEQYVSTGGWPDQTTQQCKDWIHCLEHKSSVASRVMVKFLEALKIVSPHPHHDLKATAKEESDDSGRGRGENNRGRGENVEDDSDDEERTTASLNEVTAASLNEQCYDPSNSTQAISLMECNCMKSLVDECGGILVDNIQHCLIEKACTHSKVCPGWRQTNCNEDGEYIHRRFRTAFPDKDEEAHQGLTQSSMQARVFPQGMDLSSKEDGTKMASLSGLFEMNELIKRSKQADQPELDRRLDSTLQSKCA
jgi:hypothetical protein